MGLTREQALFGFVAIPNTVIDNTKINSMGFTGDEPAITKPDNTIRILTLGGSVMFNRMMTERLKKALTDSIEYQFEVVGAALRTHTTMSSILKYDKLSKFNFDYVIIYHGINDLWTNHTQKEYFSNDYSHLNPWYQRDIGYNNSIIWRIVYNKIFFKNHITYSLKNPHEENGSNFESVRTFQNNLRRLIEIIRRDNATPILQTFAWSIPKNYSYYSFIEMKVGYNNKENYNRCPVELWGSPGFVNEGLKRHNQVICDLAKNYQVPLIDQYAFIGENLIYFGDVCHLSEVGTEAFILNIVKCIKQLI